MYDTAAFEELYQKSFGSIQLETFHDRTPCTMIVAASHTENPEVILSLSLSLFSLFPHPSYSLINNSHFYFDHIQFLKEKRFIS